MFCSAFANAEMKRRLTGRTTKRSEMDFVMVGVFGLWGKDGSGGAAEIDSGGFWRFCGVRSIAVHSDYGVVSLYVSLVDGSGLSAYPCWEISSFTLILPTATPTPFK